MSRKTHSYSAVTVDALGVLGRQIEAERRTLQWTQADLAERAGVSRQTLMAIEQGSTNSTIGIVFEIATLLGIEHVALSTMTSEAFVWA
jgi:DNA-binding XRE family transcriptional regulator